MATHVTLAADASGRFWLSESFANWAWRWRFWDMAGSLLHREPGIFVFLFILYNARRVLRFTLPFSLTRHAFEIARVRLDDGNE
jgi:hypothetical protein